MVFRSGKPAKNHFYRQCVLTDVNWLLRLVREQDRVSRFAGRRGSTRTRRGQKEAGESAFTAFDFTWLDRNNKGRTAAKNAVTRINDYFLCSLTALGYCSGLPAGGDS